MVRYLPKEILPGDLLAGARFNVQTSTCLSRKEVRERDKQVYGPKGARDSIGAPDFKFFQPGGIIE